MQQEIKSSERPVQVRAKDVTKVYRGSLFSPGFLPVLHGVSFDIFKGESFGLIGESGSGKSTLARCLAGLEKPSTGRIFHNGIDWASLPEKKLRRLRKKTQLIFQNPFLSINPKLKVGYTLREVLRHFRTDRGNVERELTTLITNCRLEPSWLDRFPAELSGGQLQRVAIARALAARPDFLIADEPTSNLDVFLRADLIELIQSLRRKHLLTVLWISHDLLLIQKVADRIGIIYQGRLVELAPSSAIRDAPVHPYTNILLGRQSIKNARNTQNKVTSSGCPFFANCEHSIDLCTQREPEFVPINENHFVRCHLAQGGGGG